MSDDMVLKLGQNIKISIAEDTSTLIEYSAKENHIRAIIDIILSTDDEVLIISEENINRMLDEYKGLTREITTDNITIKKPGAVKHSDINCDDFDLVVTLTYTDYMKIKDDITISTRFIAGIEVESEFNISYHDFEQVYVLEVISKISKDEVLKTAFSHRKNVYGELDETRFISFGRVVEVDTEEGI